MNSTTSETTLSSASCSLVCRTKKRLIFCSRRNCCSVRARRCSSSLTSGHDFYYPTRPDAAGSPQKSGATAAERPPVTSISQITQ